MRLAVHAVLIALALPFCMPLFWMVGTSLKEDTQVFPKEIVTNARQLAALWWPNPVRWANYPDALQYVPFPVYLIALRNVNWPFAGFECTGG